MKKIYLLNIEGTNTANVKYALENNFHIELILSPLQIEDEEPNIILPGNGSFGYYVSFLKKNNWISKLSSIINDKKGGKLFSICSGFQVLGISSEESKGVDGLKIIDFNFKNLKNYFESPLIINIGRKNISNIETGIQFKDLGFNEDLIKKFSMRPYFVHGFASEIDYKSIARYPEYCYLFTEINKRKILAGMFSENFSGTQFHPELSGSEWKDFMIRFFK
tara:strand:- start:1905 stop:2567 length:663 start_codon:yes stop_codon:yes gene_type:complete